MATSQDQRPLSPHLGIYRWQISMTLSILHRATGFALTVGSLFLVAWLWSAAYDGEYFAFWQEAADHWAGQALLIGWTFAFFFHLGNGIRHLFWDIGKGFELHTMARSGITVVIFAVVATAGVWFVICDTLSS
jgi:succinate dehydrogenase / fumarate reductase cytochrome b subunit